LRYGHDTLQMLQMRRRERPDFRLQRPDSAGCWHPAAGFCFCLRTIFCQLPSPAAADLHQGEKAVRGISFKSHSRSLPQLMLQRNNKLE
jgi:hypothetical protein